MEQERERIRRLVGDVLGGVSAPRKRFNGFVGICFLITVCAVVFAVFLAQAPPRCDQVVNQIELDRLTIFLSNAADIEALKIKDEILNILSCK
jgi:hypothetical protein